MAGNWDFGQAFAETSGSLQRQDITAAREPYNLAILSNEARQGQMKTAEMARASAANDEARRLASQVSLTGPGGPGVAAAKLAEIYASAGNPTMAGTMLLRASQIQAQEAAGKAADARYVKATTDRDLAMADRYANLLGGVRSQQDLDRANLIMMSEFGEEVPPEMRQYDPRAVSLYAQSALKMKDRIKLDIDRQDLARKQADSESGRALDQARVAATKALEDLRKSKIGADSKAGGKDVGAPTKMQRDAALDILEAEGVMSAADRVVADRAAYDLAAYARGLQRQNPNLDFGQALQRAFVEEKTRGAYITEAAGGVKGLFGVEKPGYVPRSGQKPPVAVTSKAQITGLARGGLFSIGGKVYRKISETEAVEVPRMGGGAVSGVPTAPASPRTRPPAEPEDDEDE